MNWVPDSADFLTAFGAAVAALAALTSIVVGVAQLTAGGKARRTLAWTIQALEDEDDPVRRQILQRLVLRTQGRLLAAHYVASWRFVPLVLVAAGSPVSVFLSGRDSPSVSGLAASLVACVSLLALPLRNAIRLYAERFRVAYQYAEGVDVEPVRTDIMELMEGGTRREFRLAYFAAVAGTVLAAAAAWASTSPNSVWPYLAVAAAAVGGWESFSQIRSYVARIARNPPPQAGDLTAPRAG